MSRRIFVGLGALILAVASLVPSLAAHAARAAHPEGPVSLEVIGPDQTGFTPALTPKALAAVRVAVAELGGHVAAVSPRPATARAAAPPTPPAPQAKRVTGLSLFLDFMQTGAGIGLSEIYGLGVSGFTTIVPTSALPPPVVQAGFTVLALPPALFDQFKAPTLQFFTALRQAIAPLAAGNAAANGLLTAVSNALITLGTTDKSLVNPFDAQVVELGKFLLVAEEPA
jgi:hypothetical protein